MAPITHPVQSLAPPSLLDSPYKLHAIFFTIGVEDTRAATPSVLRLLFCNTHHAQPSFAAHNAWQAAVVVPAADAIGVPSAGSLPSTLHSHSRP